MMGSPKSRRKRQSTVNTRFVSFDSSAAVNCRDVLSRHALEEEEVTANNSVVTQQPILRPLTTNNDNTLLRQLHSDIIASGPAGLAQFTQESVVGVDIASCALVCIRQGLESCVRRPSVCGSRIPPTTYFCDGEETFPAARACGIPQTAHRCDSAPSTHKLAAEALL